MMKVEGRERRWESRKGSRGKEVTPLITTF